MPDAVNRLYFKCQFISQYYSSYPSKFLLSDNIMAMSSVLRERGTGVLGVFGMIEVNVDRQVNTLWIEGY